MGFVLGSKKGGGLGTRGAKAWVKKEGPFEGVLFFFFLIPFPVNTEICDFILS